ncbi:MAG: DUF1295 domain-containing protein [Chloroflexota bacterium]
MTWIEVFLNGGLVVLAAVLALWLLSLALRDSSIVDIFWGPGFVLTAGAYTLLAPGELTGRAGLALALVAAWGLRLGLHLLVRNWGRQEDFRYAAWRRQHGPRWVWVSLFQVFLLQGLILWVVSAPLVSAILGRRPLGWLDGLAVLAWAVGFFFEAVGDWQLARFKADPANKGRLLTGGLWRYTRHPNYFGDALQWWGLYLLAVSAGGWWTLFSPLIMTYLLLKVSGVSLLERTLETRPGYEDYMRRTSAFVPWKPQHSKSSAAAGKGTGEGGL